MSIHASINCIQHINLYKYSHLHLDLAPDHTAQVLIYGWVI